jgi:hypothetical protein
MNLFDRFFNRIPSPDAAKTAQNKRAQMSNELATLQLLPINKLNPHSSLGQLYARYINRIDDCPTRPALDRLKREAAELEAWNKREHSAICLDMLIIKIQTACRMLTTDLHSNWLDFVSHKRATPNSISFFAL